MLEREMDRWMDGQMDRQTGMMEEWIDLRQIKDDKWVERIEKQMDSWVGGWVGDNRQI